MKTIRKIVFDISNLNDSMLESVGVYKIINKINGHFYIGSSDRNFKERFKEHCRYYEMYTQGLKHNQHPKLWNAYDKYGIENFKIELIEILDGKNSNEILEREEYYILKLNPEYNICKYPTCGGKPNLDKKLSEEWKQHIGEKSKLYKHSEETLEKIVKNNKKNAIKLIFTSQHDNSIKHYFNSWKEAGDFFKLKGSASLQNSYKRKGSWKEWNIEKLSEQKKKIKVFLEDEKIIFNSYSECDKYFNMWKGYTSELTQKKSKQLIKNKYEFELI